MIRIYLWVLIAIFTVSCKEEKSLSPASLIPESQQKTERSRDTLDELLRVENPSIGQCIQSPLEIKGAARGSWFFEAQATAELLDGNLQKISGSQTTAIGEWMTENWVPFSGTMVFEKPATENGYLILHKANPSGLKEQEMSDTIPVRFKAKTSPGL